MFGVLPAAVSWVPAAGMREVAATVRSAELAAPERAAPQAAGLVPPWAL